MVNTNSLKGGADEVTRAGDNELIHRDATNNNIWENTTPWPRLFIAFNLHQSSQNLYQLLKNFELLIAFQLFLRVY